MSVSVVIPTLPGRESLLAQTQEAYTKNTPVDVEFIVVKNRPTCGEGWNAGAKVATGSYLHLSADDVLPHPGWFEAASLSADKGEWPAPRIVRPDGSVESCGALGGGMTLPDCKDGTQCYSSPFPFMRRENWDFIGPCLPIHYYSDNALSYEAHCQGFEVVVRTGYCLTHLEGTVGRSAVVERAMDDCNAFLRSVAS